MVTLYNPPELSPPIGFSHAAGAGDWIWLAGQISADPVGTVLFPGDLTGQFRQAIKNVDFALRGAGCAPGDVVKLTYFVTDMAGYREALKPIGRAYREVFGKHFPASSLFEVSRLFEPEALIEIECVAYKEPSSVR